MLVLYFEKKHNFAKKSSTRKVFIFMDSTECKSNRKNSYWRLCPFQHHQWRVVLAGRRLLYPSHEVRRCRCQEVLRSFQTQNTAISCCKSLRSIHGLVYTLVEHQKYHWSLYSYYLGIVPRTKLATLARIGQNYRKVSLIFKQYRSFYRL